MLPAVFKLTPDGEPIEERGCLEGQRGGRLVRRARKLKLVLPESLDQRAQDRGAIGCKLVVVAGLVVVDQVEGEAAAAGARKRAADKLAALLRGRLQLRPLSPTSSIDSC